MTRSGAVIAVDLGASNGRVFVGQFSPGTAQLRAVHRFPNVPLRDGELLCWDAETLRTGVVDGLRLAVRHSDARSLGIDGWAVDYGLLDAGGALLGNPVHYRDPRTVATVERVLTSMSAAELYTATGTQLQPFNTLFQLLTDAAEARLDRAAHSLLVPDLIAYWLTGTQATEVTNASTTAMLDARTRDWSEAVRERVSVPVELFPPLREPGSVLGELRSDVLPGTRLDVVTVASHDTASAVAGVPAATDSFAYVCTGTWALVGVELATPVFSERARQANFTNELGVDRTVRFLRNVTGFWLLQECMREWAENGTPADIGHLTASAVDVPALRFLIDVQDPVFTAPGPMRQRIAAASVEITGIAPSTPGEFTRCALDSMVVAIREALTTAIDLTGRPVEIVHVVGGGVGNELFCQLLADACEVPVVAGPTEAASWGNAVVQARALGLISGSLHDLRALIGRAVAPRRYEPTGNGRLWESAAARIRAHRTGGSADVASSQAAILAAARVRRRHSAQGE